MKVRAAMDDEDQASLEDLREARDALEVALASLRKAMEGGGFEERAQFVFQVGFALGKLSRVSERVYR